MSHRENILIRSSNESDIRGLARLAALDSAPIPFGRALLAEVDGELRAALPFDGGPAIADPFAETAHLLELLQAHAEALRIATPPRGRALLPAAA